MPLLEVQNLVISVKRGKKPLEIVKGIDFSINQGEIAALAGESGGGKTLSALSVLRLLPPFVKITSGKILYAGRGNESIDITKIDKKSMRKIRGQDISIIFQEPGLSLNPLMRAGDQILEALSLHSHFRSETRVSKTKVMELLEKLQFSQPEKIMRSWPHQLSGGMCQRVMIAIAAICRPRLLIADEPTSSLDEANKGHILSMLNQINREFGTAILFISHDLSIVQNFCSRTMIMYSGKIIEEAPSEMLFSSPKHTYTAGLISAIPKKENRGSND